jgi:HAD superfamily hydrolase (TIGR01484 family)
MIKLLATDLDGTLVDEQGHINEEDIAALRRAREMGVTVVVATGRMPATIGPFLDRLEVTAEEPVVGGHGAVTALRNGDILHTFIVPREAIVEGAAIARTFNAVPTLYTAHEIFMERVAFSPEQDEYWLAGGIPIRYDPDALAHIDEDLIKMLVVQPDVPAVPAMLEALRSRLGDRAEVVRSHQWFVEVVNKDASKGFGFCSAPPKADTASAIMRSTSPCSATFAVIARASPPSSRIIRATSFARSPCTSAAATRQPAAAIPPTIALPMPDPAPVTRARTPSRSTAIACSSSPPEWRSAMNDSILSQVGGERSKGNRTGEGGK